jgi:hypothetical protein
MEAGGHNSACDGDNEISVLNNSKLIFCPPYL